MITNHPLGEMTEHGCPCCWRVVRQLDLVWYLEKPYHKSCYEYEYQNRRQIRIDEIVRKLKGKNGTPKVTIVSNIIIPKPTNKNMAHDEKKRLYWDYKILNGVGEVIWDCDTYDEAVRVRDVLYKPITKYEKDELKIYKICEEKNK